MEGSNIALESQQASAPKERRPIGEAEFLEFMK
jgi:hypothetical protein